MRNGPKLSCSWLWTCILIFYFCFFRYIVYEYLYIYYCCKRKEDVPLERTHKRLWNRVQNKHMKELKYICICYKKIIYVLYICMSKSGFWTHNY